MDRPAGSLFVTLSPGLTVCVPFAVEAQGPAAIEAYLESQRPQVVEEPTPLPEVVPEPEVAEPAPEAAPAPRRVKTRPA